MGVDAAGGYHTAVGQIDVTMLSAGADAVRYRIDCHTVINPSGRRHQRLQR